MRNHLKKPTKRPARSPTLTLTGLLAAVAVFSIVTATVNSRQQTRAKGSLPVAVIPQGNFVTVKVAGQDVSVDGQTGQIQALTAEDARKLAAGLKDLVNQSTEGLVQAQHADGSVSIDLEGRFQNVTVAHVDRDGSLTQSCVDNPQAAGAFFGIDPQLIDGKSNIRPLGNQPIRKVVNEKQ